MTPLIKYIKRIEYISFFLQRKNTNSDDVSTKCVLFVYSLQRITNHINILKQNFTLKKLIYSYFLCLFSRSLIK